MIKNKRNIAIAFMGSFALAACSDPVDPREESLRMDIAAELHADAENKEEFYTLEEWKQRYETDECAAKYLARYELKYEGREESAYGQRIAQGLEIMHACSLGRVPRDVFPD